MPRSVTITVECHKANISSLVLLKQIDSILPCVCSAIDHRRRKNVVRTSLTKSPSARRPFLLGFYDKEIDSILPCVCSVIDRI